MNGQKKTEYLGGEIQIAAVYTKYDYTPCKHKLYDAMMNIIADLKEKCKAIEEEMDLLLKEDEAARNKPRKRGEEGSFAIQVKTKDIVVAEMPQLNWLGDGEVVTVYPPNKIQKDGVKYFKL